MPEKLGTIMKIKVSVLVIICSAGLAFGQDAPAETGLKAGGESELAALAEKEVTRRQALQEKGPVITDIELSSLLGAMKSQEAPAAVPEIMPDKPEGSADSGKNELDTLVQDEAEALLDEIRNDLRTARQSVETASNSYMVMELRINNLRNRLYQEADPARQQMLQKELDQAVTDISEVRAAEAEARRHLDLLRVEARQAGLLPGEIDDIVGTVPVTRSSATID